VFVCFVLCVCVRVVDLGTKSFLCVNAIAVVSSFVFLLLPCLLCLFFVVVWGGCGCYALFSALQIEGKCGSEEQPQQQILTLSPTLTQGRSQRSSRMECVVIEGKGRTARSLSSNKFV